MPVSDEEVAAQRKQVEKLQNQLDTAVATRDSRYRDSDNEIRMARLKAEEERLASELAVVTEQGKASTVKATTKETVAQIQDTTPTSEAASVADEAGKGKE